jgi:cytochrome b561
VLFCNDTGNAAMSSVIDGEAHEAYTGTAKFFHWIVALFVLTTIPLGLVMGSLPEGPAIRCTSRSVC